MSTQRLERQVHLNKRPPAKTKLTKSPPPPAGCVCGRSKGNILCRMCGWMGFGRVRAECPIHPRTLYLMDVEQCPTCRSYRPFIQEILLD